MLVITFLPLDIKQRSQYLTHTLAFIASDPEWLYVADDQLQRQSEIQEVVHALAGFSSRLNTIEERSQKAEGIFSEFIQNAAEKRRWKTQKRD